MPTHCDLCGGSLASGADMELIGEYDEIEVPPVKPHVVRHRRFAWSSGSLTRGCEHCGSDVKAPAPAVATQTPFGPRIHALAIYCKGFQALSYERPRFMFRDAFGLCVRPVFMAMSPIGEIGEFTAKPSGHVQIDT